MEGTGSGVGGGNVSAVLCLSFVLSLQTNPAEKCSLDEIWDNSCSLCEIILLSLAKQRAVCLRLLLSVCLCVCV